MAVRTACVHREMEKMVNVGDIPMVQELITVCQVQHIVPHKGAMCALVRHLVNYNLNKGQCNLLAVMIGKVIGICPKRGVDMVFTAISLTRLRFSWKAMKRGHAISKAERMETAAISCGHPLEVFCQRSKILSIAFGFGKVPTNAEKEDDEVGADNDEEEEESNDEDEEEEGEESSKTKSEDEREGADDAQVEPTPSCLRLTRTSRRPHEKEEAQALLLEWI